MDPVRHKFSNPAYFSMGLRNFNDFFPISKYGSAVWLYFFKCSDDSRPPPMIFIAFFCRTTFFLVNVSSSYFQHSLPYRMSDYYITLRYPFRCFLKNIYVSLLSFSKGSFSISMHLAISVLHFRHRLKQILNISIYLLNLMVIISNSQTSILECDISKQSYILFLKLVVNNFFLIFFYYLV